jgi:hypothetical protein
MDWLLLGWLFVMALGWAMVLWLELVKKWYWDQDSQQDLDQPWWSESEKDSRLLDLSKNLAQEKKQAPKLPREKAQVREIELG